MLSGLAQNPVELGSTLRTDALGHARAFFADVNCAFCIAFVLAFHAVELTAPCFGHGVLPVM